MIVASATTTSIPKEGFGQAADIAKYFFSAEKRKKTKVGTTLTPTLHYQQCHGSETYKARKKGLQEPRIFNVRHCQIIIQRREKEKD